MACLTFGAAACNFQSRAAEARNFEQSSLRLRKGAVFECTPSKNNGVMNDDLKNEIEAALKPVFGGRGFNFTQIGSD